MKSLKNKIMLEVVLGMLGYLSKEKENKFFDYLDELEVLKYEEYKDEKKRSLIDACNLIEDIQLVDSISLNFDRIERKIEKELEKKESLTKIEERKLVRKLVNEEAYLVDDEFNDSIDNSIKDFYYQKNIFNAPSKLKVFKLWDLLIRVLDDEGFIVSEFLRFDDDGNLVPSCNLLSDLIDENLDKNYLLFILENYFSNIESVIEIVNKLDEKKRSLENIGEVIKIVKELERNK